MLERKFSPTLSRFLKEDLLSSANYQASIIDVDHICVSQNCLYNVKDAYDIKCINQMPEGSYFYASKQSKHVQLIPSKTADSIVPY